MLLVSILFLFLVSVVILHYFANKLVNHKLVSVIAMSTALVVLHFGVWSGIRVLRKEFNGNEQTTRMTTAEQLKTLTEKLATMEAQLNRGSGSAAAEGLGSSSGEVTVKVPRERKLRKFTGVRDDHLIEDWILDAKRAISSQYEADAVDFLQ